MDILKETDGNHHSRKEYHCIHSRNGKDESADEKAPKFGNPNTK